MVVICHFYNEEYLFPWWLQHHRKIFDHGLMINYASTDKSVDIIKSFCPTWEIVNSRNEFFGAEDINREIETYEKDIVGKRIVLNLTEFLIGNFSKLDYNNSYKIPMSIMIDKGDINTSTVTLDQSLLAQKTFGTSSYKHFNLKFARLLHESQNYVYPIGRHYLDYDTSDFIILRYDYAPWNDQLVKRKQQIGPRVPAQDLVWNFGNHHVWNTARQETERQHLLTLAEELSATIQSFEYWNYNL